MDDKEFREEADKRISEAAAAAHDIITEGIQDRKNIKRQKEAAISALSEQLEQSSSEDIARNEKRAALVDKISKAALAGDISQMMSLKKQLAEL